MHLLKLCEPFWLQMADEAISDWRSTRAPDIDDALERWALSHGGVHQQLQSAHLLGQSALPVSRRVPSHLAAGLTEDFALGFVQANHVQKRAMEAKMDGPSFRIMPHYSSTHIHIRAHKQNPNPSQHCCSGTNWVQNMCFVVNKCELNMQRILLYRLGEVLIVFQMMLRLCYLSARMCSCVDCVGGMCTHC